MDLSTLTAEEFRRVWDHYDADGKETSATKKYT